jgi:hypothetical protein
LFPEESLYPIEDIKYSERELDNAKKFLALIYLYVAAVTFFRFLPQYGFP